MTPDQFRASIERAEPAPAYLFLGPEAYQRRVCRDALVARALAPEERADGLVRHDLEETALPKVLDDACSLSLFVARRVIWVSGAEAAVPSGRAAADSDESGPADGLARYLRNPTPGVTLVFDAGRFDFDGEDKTKLERVRKFYAAIPAQVELRRYTTESARKLAAQMARDAGLRLGAGEIELLVEALGADAASIANEVEKLRLYSGGERPIDVDVIAALIPNGRATNIFALVAALGSGDRRRSLDVLDTLVRAGEYLPLALSFLATQFRLALVAHEANLRGAGQIQAHFSRIGTPMWRARAEQVHQTMTAFPRHRLETALGSFYAADKALRDTRPDDRIIMEELVWNLTR